jgi:hypothetical protein
VSGVGVYMGGNTTFSAGEGYVLTEDAALSQVNSLILSKTLKAQSCPGTFALTFNLLLSKYTGSQAHADGFTVSFLDARFRKYAWTPHGRFNMSSIANLDVEGVVRFNTSGLMLLLDLYDNSGHRHSPQIGFRASGVTMTSGKGPHVDVDIAPALNGSSYVRWAATGSAVSHIVEYSTQLDTFSYRVGDEWVYQNVSTGGTMPSSFVVAFTANSGGVSNRAVLSGPVTVACNVIPSPPPPVPPPPPSISASPPPPKHRAHHGKG